VLADQPPRVLPVGTGFRAETGRIRHQINRQFFLFQDFIPVNVRDRNFRRRNQVIVHAFNFKKIFLELGKLAGPGHTLGVDHEGRKHLRVAVVCRMQIQHEVGDRPLQLGARPAIKRESCPGDFRAAREVQNVQVLTQFKVLLRRKTEGGFFAPGPHDRVVFGSAALRHGFVLNVRHDHDKGVELLFRDAQGFVVLLDFGRYVAHFGDQLGRVLFFLFQLADLLGHAVAFVAQGFHRLQDVPSFCIQADKAVKVNVLPPFAHFPANGFQVLPQVLNI